MDKISRLALIALGSNEKGKWGDAAETVQKAMMRIAGLSQAPALNSNLFRSAAFPSGSGPDFVNAATGIVTTLSAPDLLAQLHAIEHQAGRIRQTRWGPRTLDLDLVALGDLVLPDTAEQTRWRTLPPADQPEQAPDQLILPHPRLQDRAFVLIPLAEIAPDWKHPQTGQTVFDMLAACSAQDIASVTAMTT